MTGQRLLAVASSGGHWVQLRRMAPAFEEFDVVWLTTNASHAREVAPEHLFSVRDASRWNKLHLFVQALQVLWVVVRVRPDYVVSTGAAVGWFALRFAKALGARTVWVDSIANADELSLAGKKASTCADLWLTQWPHLERGDRPAYRGSVL